MELLYRAWGLFVDYLFPRTAAEAAFLTYSPTELLTSLPHAAHISEEAWALFEYAHAEVKDAVWRVKYKGDRAVANKFGVLLLDALLDELYENQWLEKYGTPLVVAMPVSDKRRLERGWNQAELLSEALIASDTGKICTYMPRALRKIRHTESQTHTRNRHERLENLRHSMEASRDVSGRLVVVVDDVITTGATLAEAKRALASANARKVVSLAVAH